MSTARTKSAADRPSSVVASRSSWAGLRAKVLLLVVMIGAAIGGVMLILWIQDRPLRQAAELLAQGLDDRALAIERNEPTDDRKIKDAYHLVSEYLESYPTSSGAIALQARILVHMDRANEALRLFEEVEAASPEELHDLARAYMKLEQYDAALPVMEQVLRMRPDDEDVLYEISTCRINLGLFQPALESAERFARIPGAEARGHLLLATLHNELDNSAEAIKELEKVLQLEPEAKHLRVSPAYVFYFYGSGLQRLGRSDEALAPLTRSLELERNAETYVAIGRVHADLGDATQADRALRQALEVDPLQSEARELLAIAALEDDDAVKALDWLVPLTRPPTGPAASIGLPTVGSSTAFLLQQAYARAGDAVEAEKWRAHAERVRKTESLIKIVNDVLRVAPASMWGRAIRAHAAAFANEWVEAEELASVIGAEDRTAQPFLDKLILAIEARDQQSLPGFELLPVDLYD